MTRIVALDVGSSSVRAVAYDEPGVPSPATRTSRIDDLDADALVDACRAVLAQVGEGDALAISCFWHSLVAVDGADRPLTPVLTWRDLAGGEPPALDPVDYHRRTGCFLHPAYWPAKIRRLDDEGVRRGALPLVRRLPAAAGSPARPAPASRRRAAPASSTRTSRRGTRRRSTRSALEVSGCAPSRTSPWPASGPRSATAPARTSAPAASTREPRRVDGRHVRRDPGRSTRPERRSRGPASSSTGSTGDASARAARSRTAAISTRGSRARCATSIRATSRSGRPAAHGLTLPAVPRRRAVARLGRDTPRADRRALVRDDPRRHRAGRARGRLLPLRRRARGARRRRVRRRHRRRAARESRPGCRCSPTSSAGRSRSPRSRRARRAERRSSRSSGSASRCRAGPVAHVVEPRADRHAAHVHALAEQRALISLQTDA